MPRKGSPISTEYRGSSNVVPTTEHSPPTEELCRHYNYVEGYIMSLWHVTKVDVDNSYVLTRPNTAA